MSNVLILGETAIGDTICATLPIARCLKEQGHTVNAHFATENSYNLMKEVPYFDSISKVTENRYHQKDMNKYDKIYVRNCKYLMSHFKNVYLKKNMTVKYDNPTWGTLYRVQSISNQLKMKLDINISIKWYDKYYENFNISKKTILLNTQSLCVNRCYFLKSQLIEILKSNNFDIVEIDVTKNICENLHLINQSKYVITVDTGVLWLAKALGKIPYVIVPPYNNDERFNDERFNDERFNDERFNVEKLLGVITLDSKSPQSIVENFLSIIGYKI